MVKIELRPAEQSCQVDRYTVSWVDAWDAQQDEATGNAWIVGTFAGESTVRRVVESARDTHPPMPGAFLVVTDSCGNRRYDLE